MSACKKCGEEVRLLEVERWYCARCDAEYRAQREAVRVALDEAMDAWAEAVDNRGSSPVPLPDFAGWLAEVAMGALARSASAVSAVVEP